MFVFSILMLEGSPPQPLEGGGHTVRVAIGFDHLFRTDESILGLFRVILMSLELGLIDILFSLVIFVSRVCVISMVSLAT